MNPTLVRIFGQEWLQVRSILINGKEMYMAFDICKILRLSNVTQAIKGTAGTCNVSAEERTMEQVDEWNKFRTCHVLTLSGVFQLILNNKSAECRRIKEYVISGILPKCIFKFRYNSSFA